MKPAVVGGGIGLATAAALMLWSCTTNRPSEQLECSTQSDCTEGRICTDGYCVVGTLRPDAGPPDAAVCPDICNGTCDFAQRACTITGSGSGSIACPAGWNCTINCASAGACGSINCTSASSCDINCTSDMACLGVTCGAGSCDVECTGNAACGSITCTTGDCTTACASGFTAGSAACGTINCGTGRCNATCTGSVVGMSACGTVNCGESCACDVACNEATNVCPSTMNCPDAPGNDMCTTTGNEGARCSSTFAAQCDRCP